MATLNIRNLPDSTHRRLRVRAAHHGLSMEGEARQIIETACRPEPRRAAVAALPAWVAKLYGGQRPRGVVADLLAERRREAARE